MLQKIFGNSNCPSCKYENILRISRPRSSNEKILQLFPFYKIYRCKKCGWRGGRFHISWDTSNIKKIVFYILLMLLAAIIVYRVLKLVV